MKNNLTMNQKNIILLACASCSAISAMGAPAVTHISSMETQRPNLLYIFPDQYRLHALSLWSDPEFRNALSTAGDPVHTPNIDKLAHKGVIFNNACSTFPVSSPHRGMLMSGMYPRENGIEINCRVGRTSGLKPEIECLTDVLAKAGYETAYVGKTHWHKNDPFFDKQGNYVGTNEAPGGKPINYYDTYIPEGKSRHGNKFWFQGIKSHFISKTYSNRPELVGGKKDGEVCIHNGFTAAHEADIVIKYLQNKHGERAEGKPFSMIWSINPPHPPYYKLSDCDQTVYEKYYKDMPLDQLFVRKNAAAQWVNEKNKKEDIQLNARIYFSLIKSIDDEVGRVLKALEETGEADNTIVVFTSDHGEMMGSHQLMGKGVIYEESFLVPYIVSYPKMLSHQVNDLMFGSVDIMPTLLGLMGLGNQIPASVMGKDYSDGIITGTYKKNQKPTSAAFLSDISKGVRTYTYTYVVHTDGSYELYNRKQDPYQQHPLKLEDIPAADVEELQTAVGQWINVSHDRWGDEKKHAELIHYQK